MKKEELYKMEYETVVKLISHYSMIRLSGITFMITMAMGSFTLYSRKAYPFFLFFGFFMLLLATFTNYYYGRHTAKGLTYIKFVWDYLKGSSSAEPVGFFNFGKNKKEIKEIRYRMRRDLVNWIFYPSILFIIIRILQSEVIILQGTLIYYLIATTLTINILFLIKLLCAK